MPAGEHGGSILHACPPVNTTIDNTNTLYQSTHSSLGDYISNFPVKELAAKTDPVIIQAESEVKTDFEDPEPDTGCPSGTSTAREENNNMEINKNKTMASPIPSQSLIFTNPKTGKTWDIGQDVECLSYELSITLGEAKVLLDAGHGKGVAAILAMLKANWKVFDSLKTIDKAAYMLTIIKGMPMDKATPTQQTPPPVPPAGALTKEQIEFMLCEPSELDYSMLANKPTVAHKLTVDPYAWIGQPAAEGEIPYEPTVDCDNVFTRSIVQEQATRNAEHATAMARSNRRWPRNPSYPPSPQRPARN